MLAPTVLALAEGLWAWGASLGVVTVLVELALDVLVHDPRLRAALGTPVSLDRALWRVDRWRRRTSPDGPEDLRPLR
ncbi:hypothetical protein WDV85_09460 [Pseudokineococcus sp. 5B2Z-1]|uniref:hypothetical protein n=1 Tax=Pseudokineococcus sp. 5B2Z-1 TaxID=3132744 RepID=UPI0030B5ADA2